MRASTAAAVRQPAPVAAIDDWTQQRIEFVRAQFCAGAPDAVADAFMHIARKRRLSPEERQIYLVKRGDKWSIETGIDGFRLIADRTERYAGSDEPVYRGSDEEHPESASVTVWKMMDGQRCPFTASARWSEYLPPAESMRFMWHRMPFHMLAKCAEALALRKAFPADLSGIYLDAEMEQAGRATYAVDVVDRDTGEVPTPRAVPPPPRRRAHTAEDPVAKWLDNIARAKTGERLSQIYDGLMDAQLDNHPEIATAFEARSMELADAS